MALWHIEQNRRFKLCAPGLANVDNVDTVWASLPEVWLHVNLEVLAAEVGLSCEKHLNVLAGGVHAGGEVRRGHCVGLVGEGEGD